MPCCQVKNRRARSGAAYMAQRSRDAEPARPVARRVPTGPGKGGGKVITNPKFTMYFNQPRTSRFSNLIDGFGGAAVAAVDPRSNQECRAEERRISPVVEPPAAELVSVERRHGGPRQLHRDAYAAYQRLNAVAEADGIPANLLTIVSAYRSVASQRALWEAALRKYGSPQAARRWVAPPGGSAHHTGRAIDFFLGGPNNSENVAQLRRTAAYR